MVVLHGHDVDVSMGNVPAGNNGADFMRVQGVFMRTLCDLAEEAIHSSDCTMSCCTMKGTARSCWIIGLCC